MISEIIKDLKEFVNTGAVEYGYEMPLNEAKEVIEAFEKKDRINPCEFCDEEEQMLVWIQLKYCKQQSVDPNYCPMCGRKLQEEEE